MTPESFRRIRNIFEAALEREPAVRTAFVEEACAADAVLISEVRRLLTAHEREVAFLDGSCVASTALRTDPLRLEGRRLGAYEILREIGRGGMGEVYLARRADGVFEQTVAIKVVRAGMADAEVLRRFQQEREILAGLSHPNIARLFDGGTTEEGWPYFVMEYVDGEPIDTWCDRRKLRISERVRLFETVCEAVHYAHQKRVIHRDLKPGNILVAADGVVKLLDFGIAKIVASADGETVLATRTGARLMTPEYASPEQTLAAEVTPLTDVYSLGAVLYELLTGRRPFQSQSRAFHELARLVCEQQPNRPSAIVVTSGVWIHRDGTTEQVAPLNYSQAREGTPVDLQRRLTGDLDNIILRALDKQPLRRYRSADQLRLDLRRHLAGKPVEATPVTVTARAVGFATANRVPLLFAGVFAVALMTGGVRVSPEALAGFGAVSAALVFWRALEHPRLGRIVHDFRIPFGAAGLLAFMVLSQRFSGGPAAIDLALCFSIAGAMAYQGGKLINIAMRERTAGPLLHRMSLQLTAGYWISSGASLLIAAIAAMNPQTHGTHFWLSLTLSLGALTGLLFNWFALRQVDVRQRGIFTNGTLIPWTHMESYRWSDYDAGQRIGPIATRCDVLHLKVRRLFAFLPEIKVPVPRADRESVDGILRRQLAVWPN